VEKKESGLIKEINNGRLAMIGIMGFVAEQSTEGSVPLLKGVVQHYGEKNLFEYFHKPLP